MFEKVIHLVNDIQVLNWNLCLNIDRHMNEIMNSMSVLSELWFLIKKWKKIMTQGGRFWLF